MRICGAIISRIHQFPRFDTCIDSPAKFEQKTQDTTFAWEPPKGWRGKMFGENLRVREPSRGSLAVMEAIFIEKKSEENRPTIHSHPGVTTRD